jgi:hypothetical protein
MNALFGRGERQMAYSLSSRPCRWAFFLYAIVGGISLVKGPLAYAQGVWEFGAQRLMITAEAAGPLLQEAFGAAGLASAGVLARVGGVNLEGVAAVSPPSSDLSVTYNPGRPDGERLQITAWGHTYTSNIPDWELKPIALLANSKYTADVSLFGDGPDPEHYYYIQFHPALKNTLLGVRILQADIMLMDPKSLYAVPRLQGNVILGRGESLPSTVTSANAADKIIDLMALYPIQSWILTDINTQISFSQTSSGGHFSAAPYYYFWTSVANRLRFDRHLFKYVRNQTSNSDERSRINRALDNVRAAEQRVTEDTPPEALTEVTNKLRQKENLLSDLNPLVWHAVQITTEYTGLFRHIKQTNPAAWASFISQLRSVSISPSVETPTQWKRMD